MEVASDIGATRKEIAKISLHFGLQVRHIVDLYSQSRNLNSPFS
jgi:hypothetical protein